MTLYFIGDSHSGIYRSAADSIGREDLKGGPLVSAINLQGDFFRVEGDDLFFKARLRITSVVGRR